MASKTPNLGLAKPGPDDWADIAVVSANADKIDAAYKREHDARMDHESSRANPHHVTAQQAGADPAGTAAQAVEAHNVSPEAHTDLRLALEEQSRRLAALLDVDDQSLDQLSEIIAAIKANKSLLEQVTTSKINVADIVDSLISSRTDRPLSANQGRALKRLIDAIKVPTKLASPYALTVHRGEVTTIYDGSGPKELILPTLCWHVLDNQVLHGAKPFVDITLGTGYSRYLMELDLISGTGVDAGLILQFGAKAAYQYTKGKAVHSAGGRDTRIYWEMVPGTYPQIELTDADADYSPSYGFASRNPAHHVDWADQMGFVRISGDGVMLAPGSKIKVWGWM